MKKCRLLTKEEYDNIYEVIGENGCRHWRVQGEEDCACGVKVTTSKKIIKAADRRGTFCFYCDGMEGRYYVNEDRKNFELKVEKKS